MADQIIVQESPTLPAVQQRVEIVERKGIGHPDTICDSIAERISIELSRVYSRTFGRILHHNIDKGFLVAGQVSCELGGGRVIEPMRLIIGDRATFGIKDREVPVPQIAVQTAKEWMKSHLRHVDPDQHVDYQIELKPTSEELGAIFAPRRGLLVANDTSAAVGYAPLTPTERLVYDVERFLNGSRFKSEFPETGEDIKVMGIRTGDALSLTIAMPFLAGLIRSERAYFRLKERVRLELRRYVRGRPQSCRSVDVVLNALDREGKGLGGMYLTLLGTSAEQADSGQIGRGNQPCGVIPISRPTSGEAVAGKNPVSHVGKIYNMLAFQLAARIHREVGGVTEATVQLCSTIGVRIDRPAVLAVQVSLARGVPLPRVSGPIRRIAKDSLRHLGAFCEELAKGKYPVA